MIQDATVLGPDFWETTRAVAPIVGAFVTMATVYLRSFIRAENRDQKDTMMREIRELFSLRSDVASLEKLVSSQLTLLEKRIDRLETPR